MKKHRGVSTKESQLGKPSVNFKNIFIPLVNQIQHIPMDAGFSSIVWCSVADPYAVMMTADGTLMLLTFTCENSSPNLTVARVHIDQVCSVL